MSNVRPDLRKVDIHDREFQLLSVNNSIYCVPVDDIEEDRHQLQHDLLYRLCGDRLFFPNIGIPRKILDCGYGFGDWACAVAEEYEDCEVTGVDIYPFGIERPPNLVLFGYDLNDRLDDPQIFERNAYDLIHSRFVAPGIKIIRWPGYVRDMRRLLRPNGWLQMVEYYPNIQSSSGRLTTDSALYRWFYQYALAMGTYVHREIRIGQQLTGLMTNAGLRNVGGRIENLPIGGWERDPRKAAIGRESVDMIKDLLDSFALWPLTERLNWTAAQVEALTHEAKRELEDTTLKLYIPIYFAWGQR
ncbi:S-adenosyl-L-methionine-dependent methyltransferase [Lophiotrema nucula]|uniref:S-adenosyl-L-methionine-dependent methyltransferase n=1 Tax=Lophiotrema nucula TaxID=690887 RepID=A0A6A5Z4X1_9PLEO|nr:S-adenosyl-L-methionine-dependent methyltransferase [Lophiotrema nucula]